MSDVAARIRQLRRMILVHSYGYYHRDATMVPDHVYDAWSRELAELQARFPREAESVEFHDLFADWDGSTGYHLPAMDWVVALWERLYACHEKRKEADARVGG